MTCAAAGARTVLVAATRGERGKAGNPPVCAPGEIAACRERGLFLRDVSSMGTTFDARALRISVKDAGTNERMLNIIGSVGRL